MAEYFANIGFVYILLLFLSWAMPSLMRTTLPFGVRIPGSRAGEPVIARELRRYRWRVIISGVVIAAIIGGLTVATGWQEVAIGGPLLLIVVEWIWYFVAHRRIAAVKNRERWYAGLRQGIVADTSIRTKPDRYPWRWALPAVGLWVASVVIGIAQYPHLPATLAIHYNAHGVANGWAPTSIGSAFSVVFIAGVATALIIGVSLLGFRSRQELDVEHPAASANQHRAFVRQMTQALLFLAACVNVATLVVNLMIWNAIAPTGTVALLGAGLPFVVGILGVAALAIRVGQSGHRIPAEDTGGTGLVNRDDDRFWIAGMFYVNRNDPAFLVDKRFGIGWTLNFGHPGAWVFMVMLLAIIFAQPLITLVSR